MSEMKPEDSRNVDHLREVVRRGARAKYVFFWSHDAPSGAPVTSACLSQWYAAAFSAGGVRYPTSEHFMMAEKARLFGDSQAEAKVLGAPNPGAAKRFGREVRNFDQATWDRCRRRVAVEGNFAKFSQNRDLAEFLLGTARRVLVEASPVDPIWGIGLSADVEGIEDPEKWPGLNLLGFALMEVRSLLQKGAESVADTAEPELAPDGPLRGPQVK